MIDMKSVLQRLAFQQGREELSPEEEALLQQQQQQPDPMERIMIAQGPNPADVLGQSPGSTANRLMNRRRALEEAGGMSDGDMLAQNDADRYGGVSMQTRAAMDKLGREVGGDMSDMVVGGNRPAPSGGTSARVTTRGAQSASQEEQLVKMLKGRGMSEGDARARAREMGGRR